MTFEEKKAEALLRLAMWQEQGLDPIVLKKFKRDILYYSEESKIGNNDLGLLFPINKNDGVHMKWLQHIKEYEEKCSALVYHVIHGHAQGFEVLIMLYVSNQPQEWEWDREELADGLPFVFVYCLTKPRESEFGNINCLIRGGGMIQV